MTGANPVAEPSAIEVGDLRMCYGPLDVLRGGPEYEKEASW